MPKFITGSRKQLLGAGVALYLLVWAAFNLSSLSRYPSATCDEAFYARSALRYTEALLAGERWPQSGTGFYLPHGRIYWALLGGALTLLGQTMFTGRLVSLAGLAGVMAATYLVGRRYASPRVGLWSAALIGVTWIGLHTGHRARPDMLAVAASIGTVGLAHVLRERGQAWLFGALGLALTLQLDIHPLTMHIGIPLAVMVAIGLIRDRAWASSAWFVLGLAVGGVVLLQLHLGPQAVPMLKRFLLSPLEVAQSQGLMALSGANSSVLDVLLASPQRFGNFWWHCYAWLTPVFSLPQAVLFVLGLVGALIKPDRNLFSLAMLVIFSSALFDLAEKLRSLPIVRRWPEALLTGLWLTYVAGGAYLVFTRPARAYQTGADRLVEHIEPGARVMAHSTWWYALHDKVVFLDETLLTPVNSGLWWNSVPETDDMELADLPVKLADEGSPEANARRVEAVLRDDLRPDYVIDDQVMGCLSSPSPLSEPLTAYLEQVCTPVDDITLEVYGRQVVYACDW